MANHGVYLFITPFFPSPMTWRGGYCLDFAKSLMRQTSCANRRMRVCLFVPGASDYEIDGVKVHGFREWRLPSNIFPNLFAWWNKRRFLAAVAKIGIDLADVVVCHANTANLGIYSLAVKARNPNCMTLLHHHDLASFGLNMGVMRHCWFYNMIQYPVLRRMHEKIDCHVFISEASRRSFLAAPNASWTEYADYKKQMRGLPYRPVRIKSSVILHNGVDKRIFRVEVKSASRPKERSHFAIGCVGNFQELKGQETLIRAVARVNEVAMEKIGSSSAKATKGVDAGPRKIKILFVGSGERLEPCKRLARELGVDVEFLREVSHEKLAAFYRQLDLFALPSWFEGFGCVYTEAHACGVPFIACEGQGVADVLVVEKVGVGEERSPWLCRPRDPTDLARVIERAITELEKAGEEQRDVNLIQPLNEDQDIDSLVGRFVKEIGL